MSDLSGYARLVEQYPGHVTEATLTHGAEGSANYRAAITIFADGGYTTRGHVVGTGCGTSSDPAEAFARAVADWTPTAGESEAA